MESLDAERGEQGRRPLWSVGGTNCKTVFFVSFLPKESACLLPNIETFLNPCICDGSANEAIVHTECRTPLELSPTIERAMFISLLQSLNLSGDWALYQSL